MGNTCKCIKRRENLQTVEIVIDDSANVTIKDFRTNANRIKKIRFILPIIKVTDDNNQEHLVFHPEGAEFSGYRLSSLGSASGGTITEPSTSKSQGVQKSASSSGDERNAPSSSVQKKEPSSVQKTETPNVPIDKSSDVKKDYLELEPCIGSDKAYSILKIGLKENEACSSKISSSSMDDNTTSGAKFDMLGLMK